MKPQYIYNEPHLAQSMFIISTYSIPLIILMKFVWPIAGISVLTAHWPIFVLIASLAFIPYTRVRSYDKHVRYCHWLVPFSYYFIPMNRIVTYASESYYGKLGQLLGIKCVVLITDTKTYRIMTKHPEIIIENLKKLY